MAFELSHAGARCCSSCARAPRSSPTPSCSRCPRGEVERLVERELRDNPALERAERPPPPRTPGWAPAPASARAGRRARPARAARPRRAREPAARGPSGARLPARQHRRPRLPDGRARGRSRARSARRWSACSAVHALVRELGPLGFASRDVRDCLAAQLDQRRRRPASSSRWRGGSSPSSLADLAAGRYGALSRRLGVDRARIVAARDLIRARLRPVSRARRAAARRPRAAERARHHRRARSRRPDRAARRAHRGAPLRAAREPAVRRPAPPRRAALTADERRRTRSSRRRARAAFVRRLHERWTTIRRVTEYAVAEQRAFVLRGPAALRPLTRAMVAAELGLHESTVSRAVAGRSVLLPCGRLVELQGLLLRLAEHAGGAARAHRARDAPAAPTTTSPPRSTPQRPSRRAAHGREVPRAARDPAQRAALSAKPLSPAAARGETSFRCAQPPRPQETLARRLRRPGTADSRLTPAFTAIRGTPRMSPMPTAPPPRRPQRAGARAVPVALARAARDGFFVDPLEPWHWEYNPALHPAHDEFAWRSKAQRASTPQWAIDAHKTARKVHSGRRTHIKKTLKPPPRKDVHHKIELQVLKGYPGVFDPAKLEPRQQPRGGEAALPPQRPAALLGRLLPRARPA